MRLLALDSSGDACSGAAWDDGRPPGEELAGHRRVELARGHAEVLVPLLRDVLADCGWGFDEVDVFVACHGPGTFTGVRVAVAAARAFALAAGRPVLAVSGLEALATAALACAPDLPVLAAIDARRGEVYAQAFGTDRRPLDQPRAVAPERALDGLEAPVRLVGSGARLVQDGADAAARERLRLVDVPLDARLVAASAALRLSTGERPIPGPELHPLYLRAPDARPAPGLVARAGA